MVAKINKLEDCTIARYRGNMNHLVLATNSLAIVLLLSGCVTTGNHCGNEQRNWSDLQFPKQQYCSVPRYLPFAGHYESANKAVCKVHDNNSGKYATMPQLEADKRFLCDYIKRSEFPWGIRHVTGYLSYVTLRVNATGGSVNHSNYSANESETASTPSVLIDGTGNAVKNSQGQPLTIDQESAR